MNTRIIRVCEIALSALTNVQIGAQQMFELKMIKENDQKKAGAINKATYEIERLCQHVELDKKEVKELLDIAYRKNIREVDND